MDIGSPKCCDRLASPLHLRSSSCQRNATEQINLIRLSSHTVAKKHSRIQHSYQRASHKLFPSERRQVSQPRVTVQTAPRESTVTLLDLLSSSWSLGIVPLGTSVLEGLRVASLLLIVVRVCFKFVLGACFVVSWLIGELIIGLKRFKQLL